MMVLIALEAARRDDVYSFISDVYKDTHGIRPRWMDPRTMTFAQLCDEADCVAEAHHVYMAEDYDLEMELLAELDAEHAELAEQAAEAEWAEIDAIYEKLES